MSNLDRAPVVTVRGGLQEVSAAPVHEVLTAKTVELGESTQVRRLLPNIHRRMVGAWCFVDHYGPDDVAARPGMQVPPHPHIGLQTDVLQLVAATLSVPATAQARPQLPQLSGSLVVSMQNSLQHMRLESHVLPDDGSQPVTQAPAGEQR